MNKQKELKKLEKEIKQLKTQFAKKYRELNKISTELLLASKEKEILKKLVKKVKRKV